MWRSIAQWKPDDPLIEKINMRFIYKIERNSRRSKYYLIRKFLPRQQSGTYHIEDSDLGIVSKLLNYADALVYCAQLNQEQLEA